MNAAWGTRIGLAAVHAGAAAVVGLLLIAAAGPLATDDLWWHLSLGERYAALGPLLDADGRLHTAVGPPHPNAWLGDLAWARLVAATDLDALRALHALLLAGILVLVWDALRRVAGIPALASLGTALFATASAYRLLQLRPELWTIALALGVHRLVCLPERPSRGRLAAAVGLCALWANLHPGFALGPGLLLGATLAHAFASVRERLQPAKDRARPASDGAPAATAIDLTLATAAAFLATCLNPFGPGIWSTDVSAGLGAVDAGLVVDEWRPLDPFAWPGLHVPPTPAEWSVFWVLTLGVLHRLVREPAARWPSTGRDATTLGLALVGLLAPLVAVRFAWLGIWPLLFVVQGLGREAPERAATDPGRSTVHPARAAVLGAASALVLALLIAGSGWGILAPRPDPARWRETYDADRYFAHAVWWLDAVEAKGRAFHVYSMGGFLGYWLGPGLQAFVDGSLNVPEGVLRDYGAIVQQDAGRVGAEDVTVLLDRYGVDWVVGVGLPRPPPPGRPWRYTTTLLEGDPRWIPVYRGLRSAVYLRDAPRNVDALARIAAYYAAERVPFDPARGLLVERALDEATGWAIEHGVAPIDWRGLRRAADSGPRNQRLVARNRLAWTWAVLGRYEAALDADAELALARHPRLASERLRRRTWCWLRLGRPEAALAELRATSGSGGSELARLAEALRRGVTAGARDDGSGADGIPGGGFLPLSPAEAGRLKAVERRASVRDRPRRAVRLSPAGR